MVGNNSSDSQSSTIVLAGATGDLGGRTAKSLLEKGATVRALVRPASDAAKVDALRQAGATIYEVDYHNTAALTKACEGGTCVVSALSGLHYVMVGIQSLLLNAVTAVGVPRFIPSDFVIDFTRSFGFAIRKYSSRGFVIRNGKGRSYWLAGGLQIRS